MRAIVVSLFFLLMVALVVAIFHYKAPRRQAHLADLQMSVDSALRPFPRDARLHFRADGGAATDYGVWCRYFAAPRRLLLTPTKSGDTVFYLRPNGQASFTSFSGEPVPVTIQIFIQP